MVPKAPDWIHTVYHTDCKPVKSLTKNSDKTEDYVLLETLVDVAYLNLPKVGGLWTRYKSLASIKHLVKNIFCTIHVVRH